MSGLIRLDFLLLGKTGSGKSATGNTLLGRKAFVVSGRSQSVTDQINTHWGECGGYQVKVVDTPGLEDTDLSQERDKERAMTNLADLMSRCPEGVHVFLLTIPLGRRFTNEDRHALDSLKFMLGSDFMTKHGIIVMTHGENFEHQMEEDGFQGLSFEDWCRQETGELRQLFVDCNFRCILWSNRENNPQVLNQRIQSLCSKAEQLAREGGRYTNENFKAFAKEREKYLVQIKAPRLKENFQEKLSLVSGDLEQMVDKSPDEKVQIIRRAKQRYEDCLREIETEDKGTGEYTDFKKRVKEQISACSQLEQNVHDAIKSKKLEDKIRKENEALQAREKWLKSTLIGAGIGLATGAASVGLVLATGGVAAVPLVTTAVGAWTLGAAGGAGAGAAAGATVGAIRAIKKK